MNRRLRRGISIALAISLALMPMVPAAAKKKVALSAKNMVLKVGEQKKISLKNAGKKVKWSISSGKKVIRLKSKKKQSVVIAAKKAGSAKVQAKLGKKKYICKVTVKKAADSVVTKAPVDTQTTQQPAVTQTPKQTPTQTPTQKPTSTPKPSRTPAPPIEKDEEQVKALQKLVQSIIDHSNVDDEPVPTPSRDPDDPDDEDDPDDWEEPDDRPTNQISMDVDDTDQYAWKNGKLTEIIWNDMGITGALSLEDFPDLQILLCSKNKITKLDLSANTELNELDCSYNLLSGSKLSVTNCKKLMLLNCSNNYDEYNNAITKLNLSKMEDLEYLDCSYNALTSLDVSKNENLTELKCADNVDLITLKMDNPNLTTLDCSTCALESLDTSSCPVLEELKCNDNIIETLNLTSNPELKKLDCEYNDLKRLNTKNNPELEELICSNNGYTDRSGNAPDLKDPEEDDEYEEGEAAATAVFAGNTVVAASVTAFALSSVFRRDVPILTYSEDDETMDIDVSKNTKLKTLKCSNNALFDLDISQNTELKSLDCSMNYLQDLDCSNNPKLSFLNCQYNDITTLDLTNLEQYLSPGAKLYCDETVEVLGNDK